MKKQTTHDNILSPDTYWEMKLDIDFEKEFARYRKLCGSFDEHEKKLLDGIYYITYFDWQFQIKTYLKKLDSDELIEFYHFLKGRRRAIKISNELTSTTLTPYFLAFAVPLFVNNFADYFITNVTLRAILNIITPLIPFYLLTIDAIRSSKKDLQKQFFYKDIMEIIKELLSSK